MAKFKILSVILSFLLITSCSEDDSITSESLSAEEAVEIIEAALAEESGGLTETAIAYTKAFVEEISQNVQCNATSTDSYEFTRNGSVTQASYTFNWEFLITCNGLSIPQSASFTANGNGSYNTQRIDSEDASTLSASITGLQPTSSEMTFNGSYERMGSQQISINQTIKDVTTDFNATITDLIVNKSDYEIASGSGVFTLSGDANGNSFSFEGSLTFNGDNTATVTINGNAYTIELN